MLMVWDDLIQSTEPMQGYVERYTVGGMAMRKQTNLSHKTKTCGLTKQILWSPRVYENIL